MGNKYTIEGLIDICKLQEVMDAIYDLTKISHYILDQDGNILAQTSKQNICEDFFCKEAACYEIKEKKFYSIKGKNIRIYKCVNGLCKAKIPIVIKDQKVGELILAQFFLEKPDLKYFKRRAEEKGFDKQKFLECLQQVPVINKKNIEDMMMYYKALGIILAGLETERSETLEYEKIRTEFLANISHEFKTPLNIIFASIQMCEFIINKISNECNDLKNIEKYVGIMRKNGYRLVKLVNNLIDIAKIESGYFEINLADQNLVSFLEDITLSVVEYAKFKEIEITFDTEVEECVIAFDKNKMEKIILNLLSNAIKFTPEGGKIFVHFKDKNEYVLITVEDNGIGIPEDKQNKIFEKFTQVDKSLSRNTEGSGVGLSLIKSFVEIHNGHIWVESEYGEGSKFFIKIPKRNLEYHPKEIKDKFSDKSEDKRIQIEFSDIYF